MELAGAAGSRIPTGHYSWLLKQQPRKQTPNDSGGRGGAALAKEKEVCHKQEGRVYGGAECDGRLGRVLRPVKWLPAHFTQGGGVLGAGGGQTWRCDIFRF